MRVWQIAAGEPGRDYSSLFFDHDIMLIGPSSNGNALENEYVREAPNSPLNQVYSFSRGPKPGDRVIVRLAHEVIGIGQLPVNEDTQYSFEEVFRCVYGWDICHCRRVIWAENFDLGKLATVFQGAKQKPSFTQIHEKRILEMVLAVDDSSFDRPLKKMPQIDHTPYSNESLGVELFRAGISNRNIEDILKALQQAERLCTWYRSEKCGRKPSENEIVSHIILPLFLGLGWSHQQIAVEWNRVDVAFFKTTPTTAENCVIVLEAKGLGIPLSEVLEQPIGYVNNLGLKNVPYILTTDGENLFVYCKTGNNWNPNPVGYVSITHLQKEYVIPENVSLIDTLVMLQPGLVQKST